MAKRVHGGAAAGAAMLALAALGALLLPGCGGGEQAERSSPHTITVAPTAPTATVDAAIGDKVVVSLDANVTTGYEWQFTAGDTLVIEKSEYVPDPNPDELVGSGGTQVVTLRVTKAGTSALTGIYVRPWETPSPSPAADVTVTITAD
jgi:inhibitor of cysteine peptidase